MKCPLLAVITAVFFLGSCVTSAPVRLTSPAADTQYVPLDKDGSIALSNQVEVDSVQTGLPAQQAGLKQGDILLSIQGIKPITSTHAISLLNNTVSATLQVQRNNSPLEVVLKQSGTYGLVLKDTNPPSNTLPMSGAKTSFLVTNPQYSAFQDSIEPVYTHSKKIRSDNLLGGILLNLLAGGVGMITYIARDDPSFQDYKGAYIAMGVGSAGFGSWMLLRSQSKTYARYVDGVPISKSLLAENSLLDGQGYNKVTGYNMYGIDRNGTYPDGTRFTGVFSNGKKNGAGTLYVPTQTKAITGKWNNDRLDGFTVEYAASGYSKGTIQSITTYENDQKQGYGLEFGSNGKPERIVLYGNGIPKSTEKYPERPLLESLQGVFYFGPVSNGLAQGAGDARSIDGKDELSGTFNAGWLTQGTKKYRDGRKAEGTFNNEHLVNGMFTGSNGTVSRGRFSNGQLTSGYRRDADGSAREGQFTDGVLQSPGKIWNRNGDVYTGAFDGQLKPQGQGEIVYANGNTFKGQFALGIPEGSGTYVFASGDVYTGDFLNGVFNGEGRLSKKNGEVIEGSFKNNLPHGPAIYRMQNQAPERAEYFEGDRVDQAYQIRVQAAEQRAQEKADKDARDRIAQKEKQDAEYRSTPQPQIKRETNSWATALVDGLQEISRDQDQRIQNSANGSAYGAVGAAGSAGGSGSKRLTLESDGNKSSTETDNKYPDSFLNNGAWSSFAQMGQNTFAYARKRWLGNSKEVGVAEFEVEVKYSTPLETETDFDQKTSWKVVREVKASVHARTASGPMLYDIPAFRVVTGETYACKFTTSVNLRENFLLFNVSSNKKVDKEMIPRGKAPEGPVKVMRD